MAPSIMFLTKLSGRHLLQISCFFLSIVFVQASLAYVHQYERILKRGNLNIFGSKYPTNAPTLMLCAVAAAMASGHGFRWGVITGSCEVYTHFWTMGDSYHIYPRDMTNRHIYMRMDLNTSLYIDIDPRQDDLTWDSAQAFCQQYNENLAFFHDITQMNDLADFYGNLFVGGRQDTPGVWTLLNGTEVTIAGADWFQNSNDICLMFYKGSGYSDTVCDSRPADYWPTLSMCTYTEPDI